MKNVIKISILAAILPIALISCKKETPKEKTLVSIGVTAQPTKKTYLVGEVFDPAGMVVTATYSDNTTAPVNVTAAMLDYNFSTVGAKTVTITYEGKTATVSGITVTAPEVTLVSIAVTEPPTKKEYLVGEEFDAVGMIVTATYSDNSTASVNVTAAMLAYDFSTTGEKTVTITYEGKTATVTGITVTEPQSSVTFLGADVKSVSWNVPVVDVLTVFPGNFWTVRPSLINAEYSGSAVLTLNFSDGTAKDSIISNLTASTMAKYERAWSYYRWGYENSLVYVEEIIQPLPVDAEVINWDITASSYTDTVRFTLVEGQFFIEYSIANSLVSTPVRGQQVPIPFGNGTLEMTKLEKELVGGNTINDKMYAVHNIFPILLFRHPVSNLEQELLRHGFQIPEPRLP